MAPIDESFWEVMEQKYLALKNGDRSWANERSPLETSIKSLERVLKHRYEIVRPLGVGGTAIVILVTDTKLGATQRAVKFPRPTEAKWDMFAEIVESEIRQLLETNHPSIVQIYDQGTFPLEEGSIPYYVMEYIAGGIDALDFLNDNDISIDEIVAILSQVVDGLERLHSEGVAHLDVKLENILVSNELRAVVSDLGSSRTLKPRSDKEVSITFTPSYAHPDLNARPAATSTQDPNRMRVTIPRNQIRTSFDLFALGTNIRRMLAIFDQKTPLNPDDRTRYVHKYLDLMSCRLLDGRNSPDQRALGIPPPAFDELKYENLSEVRLDLQKLTGEFSPHVAIPELNEFSIRSLQASKLATTPFSQRLKEVLEHPSVRRLGQISQLGTVNLVYPTATHSRLEHMLGTYTNMVRIISALYADPINPFFRQLMSEGDLRAGLLAALLHDLGQYAMAHDIEEVSGQLSHESVTQEMLRGKHGAGTLMELIASKWGVDPGRIIDILKAKKIGSRVHDRILRSLIDGPIDADKLDYLIRDSAALYLPFGSGIDFDRLIRTMTIVFEASEDSGETFLSAALGIHEKGRVPAESVAFARYAMFGTVYWHHTARAAKTMLQHAVWDCVRTRGRLKKFREGILSLITQEDVEQQTLLDQDPRFQRTQLLPADTEMINLLAELVSPENQELLKLIMDRRLYKRLVTVSKGRNKELWNIVVKVGARGWAARVALESKIEEKLLKDLRDLDHSRRSTTALGEEATSAVLQLAGTGVRLILLDIPDDRPGTTSKLRYLPERHRRETLQEWRAPVQLEDSVIWTELHDKFVEAAGKIRLFCHPAARETLEALATPAELEGLLNTKAKEVLSERI